MRSALAQAEALYCQALQLRGLKPSSSSIAGRIGRELAEGVQLVLGFLIEPLPSIDVPQNIARLGVCGVEFDRTLEPLDTEVGFVKFGESFASEKEVARRIRIPLGRLSSQIESFLIIAQFEHQIGKIAIRPVIFGVVLVHEIERL